VNKRIPLDADGKRTLVWNYGYLTRASSAHNPDTGEYACRANKPRITTNRIANLNWKEELFYTFTEPQVKFSYDGTHPIVSTKYLVGTGGRLEEWDTFCLPRGWTKETGPETSYLSKPLYRYILPKTGVIYANEKNTKHFVISAIVHGNEIDGIDGVFKAVEILTTNPRFQAFRDEYTISFFPCLNPDGFYVGVRNSRHQNTVVGTHGYNQYCNLNRNFNWFWDEYVESTSEWKGVAPNSEPETQFIVNYHNAVVAAGGSFGALIDAHATEEFGTRYITRDRLNNHITKTRDQGGEIPESWLSQNIQDVVWRMARASSIKRYRETADGIPYFIRLLRSKYDPKLHSYFSSTGAYSVVVEEAKVNKVVVGAETIASACNFRLDMILNTAAAVTTAHWETSDAILIEAAAENEFQNSTFRDWNVGEDRPSYWNYRRAELINATDDESEQHYDNADVIKLTSQLSLGLETPSEYNRVCAFYDAGDVSYNNLFGILSYGKIFYYPNKGREPVEYATTYATPVGACCCGAISNNADILCGGTAERTGASNTGMRVSFATDPPTQVALGGTGIPKLIHAGCANQLDGLLTIANNGYLVGGMNDSGNATTAIYTYDPVTKTCTAAVSVLPVALYGCCAIYYNTYVYIFGGQKDDLSCVSTIYKWNTVTDILSAVPTATLSFATTNMCGYRDPQDAKIYLFGGEGSSGDMLSVCYQFSPVTDTIVEIIPSWQSSDEYGGYENVPFDTKFGRAACCLARANASDLGNPIIIGGREDNSVGTLRDDCITYSPTDQIVSAYDVGVYSYLFYNASTDLTFAANVQVSDTFDDLANWTLSDDPWTVSGNIASLTFTALGYGTITLDELPDYFNQQVQFALKYVNTLAELPYIRICLRADGAATNGYVLQWSFASSKWSLIKFISGVGDVLLDQLVDVDPTTLNRTLIFSVEDQNPVHITASFNGTTIIDLYDCEPDRIVDKGQCVIRASASAVTSRWDISSFSFSSAGKREEKWSFSNLIRVGSGSNYPYDRLAAVPRSYLTDTLQCRFVSNYFAVASVVDYTMRKVRLDLTEGQLNEMEDGVNWYSRLYKDNQELYITGPMLTKGSLIPSSWQPHEVPRAVETMYWPQVLDLNNFMIKFKYLPLCSFAEYTAEQEFLRIYYDATNYIRLHYVYPTTLNEQQNRAYYVGNDSTVSKDDGLLYEQVNSVHDPILRLEKVRDSVVRSFVDIVSYFGFSNLTEEACEYTEDPIIITVLNTKKGLELRLERAGSEGRKFTADDLTEFTNGTGAVSLSGIGYWAQPELIEIAQDYSGRTLNIGRKQSINRYRRPQRNQLLGGDRDPTLGDGAGYYYYHLGNITFGILDDFVRTNSASVGGNWRETRYSYGWSIFSNQARCSSRGICRHTRAFPKHADYKIQADCGANTIGNAVGLLGRWDYYADPSTTGLTTACLTGYSAELIPGAGSMASLNIYRYTHYDFTVGTPPGRADILGSMIVPYTLGTIDTLYLSFSGSTITTEYGSNGPMSVTDTCYPRANYIGFIGLPVGGYCYLTNYYLFANFMNTYDD
jgi:hypothetical protein